jgi:hypothetical protein
VTAFDSLQRHLSEFERMNYLVGLAFAVSRIVTIDPLLQNGRRLEHDHAPQRNRHLGAGLLTADTLIFLEIFRHRSVSLPCQKSRSRGNTHRGIRMRAWFTHPFIKTLSFAIGERPDTGRNQARGSMTPGSRRRVISKAPCCRGTNRRPAPRWRSNQHYSEAE